jgi:hypothetical protein
MEHFSDASALLFQASAELRNKLAEIEKLKAAIVAAEAASRGRNLPIEESRPSERKLRA